MAVRPGRLAGLALVGTLLSSCASTHPLSAPPSATTSVAPIVTAGPTPGHWNAAWTRTFSFVGDANFIGKPILVGGALVTASYQGVEALDARTGKTLWHSKSFDRSAIADFAVSGQQVVIITQNGHWISVHAPTGRVSWRSKIPSGAFIPAPDEMQELATSTTIPVVTVDTKTIRGIDSQTGQTRWNIGERQLYGCTPDTHQITSSISVETKRYVSKNWLAVPVVCGARNAVVAVDAASGKPGWRRETITAENFNQGIKSARFIGINDDGYGVFEQGAKKDSYSLFVQDPSGQTKTVLDNAQSAEIWGPLSPLASVGDSMIIPFLRNGNNYFAVMRESGSGASVVNLSNNVRAATFDGTRAYGIQHDGSIKVVTVGQAASADAGSSVAGKVFWIATGNKSLFIATSDDSIKNRKITITSIGN